MIKINEKKYEITTNVKYGLMEKFSSKNLAPEEMTEFLRQILIPSPSIEEIREFGYNDVLDILEKFGECLKKRQADLRKKFSQ